MLLGLLNINSNGGGSSSVHGGSGDTRRGRLDQERDLQVQNHTDSERQPGPKGFVRCLSFKAPGVRPVGRPLGRPVGRSVGAGG